MSSATISIIQVVEQRVKKNTICPLSFFPQQTTMWQKRQDVIRKIFEEGVDSTTDNLLKPIKATSNNKSTNKNSFTFYKCWDSVEKVLDTQIYKT